MTIGNCPMFPSLARSGTASSLTLLPASPLTPQGIMTILQRICARAALIDPALAGLRPHDLRRTFAQLAKDGGADLDMIQHTMGHSSLVTTERYLRQIQNLNLGMTAPDHIRLGRLGKR